MAGDTTKKILELVHALLLKHSTAKKATLEELQKTKDKLNSVRAKYNEDKEKIDILEKEKKMAEERIKSLENDVIILKELEKNKPMSEISTSSKPITYWKDNEIYESLKQVGYIERLEVKWNYKYRTVRARIRLTKEMKDIFMKGGSNIAIKKNNDQFYYFRMFDAKMSATDIKKRYEWQAYKRIPKVYLDKNDFVVTKAFNLKFKVPQQTKKDKFVDAKSDLISTIPRTQDEHEELDVLNENFKERLEELDKDKKPSMSITKGKKKVVDTLDDDVEEKTNINKKRIVQKQGERDNSDNE
ncbi:uncharacterized protein OCT59_016222 [Rhizophagus irregularis]|nr:hypothetical protein OCT59_016222 [Rhizophagus irregularis]